MYKTLHYSAVNLNQKYFINEKETLINQKKAKLKTIFVCVIVLIFLLTTELNWGSV